jgi:hypothetical protein
MKKENMMTFNQDSFKDEMFILLKEKYKYNGKNLKLWEQLRLHHILNGLYVMVKKTRKEK